MSGFIGVVKSAETVGVIWGYTAVPGIAEVEEANRYRLVMRGIVIFTDLFVELNIFCYMGNIDGKLNRVVGLLDEIDGGGNLGE